MSFQSKLCLMKGSRWFQSYFTKVDLNKAYDHLEWDFIEAVLRQVGFPELWISLSMESITAISYSFLTTVSLLHCFSICLGYVKMIPYLPVFVFHVWKSCQTIYCKPNSGNNVWVLNITGYSTCKQPSFRRWRCLLHNNSTAIVSSYASKLELDNRSCPVGFVFVSNLNGLRIPQPESNPFIKWIEKYGPVPI